MKPITHNKPAHIAWLADIHLDQATRASELRFLKTLPGAAFEAVIVTGDIPRGREIPGHLPKLCAARGARPAR